MRYARIIDTTKRAIATNASHFPEYGDTLLQNRELHQELQRKMGARLDQKRMAGMPLTRSDVSQPRMELEPGVWHNQDWVANQINPGTRPDGLPFGKYIDIIGFKQVPMGDWDWPNVVHHNDAVTIRHLGDVYDNLERFTTDNPGSKWQTYLTPGGVRAYELSKPMTPGMFDRLGYFDELKIDPFYKQFSLNQTQLKGATSEAIARYQPLYPKQAFNARVSSKPGRNEDFVAFPLGQIGEGLINPYNQRLIDQYHDQPIMRSMMNDGMQPGKLPASGISLLEQHLATVPRKYAASIEQRLQSLGIIG